MRDFGNFEPTRLVRLKPFAFTRQVYKMHDRDSDYVSILCRTMGDPAVLFGMPVCTSVRANHFMVILSNQYNRTRACVRACVHVCGGTSPNMCISRESSSRRGIGSIASNVVFSVIHDCSFNYIFRNDIFLGEDCR